MYRISAPGQWASICQSPSAMRLVEKMTREDLLMLPICARSSLFSTPKPRYNQTDPVPHFEQRVTRIKDCTAGWRRSRNPPSCQT